MAFRVRSRLLPARTGRHKRWPKMWAALSPTLDRVVTDVYETTSLAPMNLLAGFRNIFLLWVDDDVLEAHEKALKDNTDPPPAMLAQFLKSSRVATVMFQDAAQRLDVLRMLERVGKELDDLLYHDFDETEVASFNMRCYKEVELLGSLGHADTCAAEAVNTVTFLTCRALLPSGSLNDVWQRQFQARVRSIAINSGLLEMHPWEKLLWVAGEIPSLPQAANVPREVLSDAINVRSAVAWALNGVTSFQAMLNAAQTKLKD